MIVLDASAAVELLIDGPKGGKVDEAIEDQRVHAPAMIDFEVMSALYGHVRGSLLSVEAADTAYFDFVDLAIDTWPLVVPERVLELRHNFSAYDAPYVALAEVLRCPLTTCDEKWLRAPRVHHADIRVL